jgi:hypothetical protein
MAMDQFTEWNLRFEFHSGSDWGHGILEKLETIIWARGVCAKLNGRIKIFLK